MLVALDVLEAAADEEDAGTPEERAARREQQRSILDSVLREIGSFREGGLAGQWLLASTTLGGIDAEG